MNIPIMRNHYFIILYFYRLFCL